MTKFWNEARKTQAGSALYSACDRTAATLAANQWGLPYNYAELLAAHHVNVRKLLRHLGLPDSAYFSPEFCAA